MNEPTQTTEAVAIPDSIGDAGQDHAHAEPPSQAAVYDISHLDGAPVPASQFVVKEKRKAGDYTPLDLLNEYVPLDSGWSLQNGRYVATLHLDVDPELQARLTIDEAHAKSRALMTYTPHIQEILTAESTGRLNSRTNALATVLRPLGSVGTGTGDYEVVSGSVQGTSAVVSLVVNPQAIDMQRAAVRHHWSQEEINGMFPEGVLQAATLVKAARVADKKDGDLLDPTRALREVFAVTATPVVGETRDFVATHLSREAIEAAASAVTEAFSALGVAPDEYQICVTEHRKAGYQTTYSLTIEPDFRMRTQEEMKPIFAAGNTESARASTQPWTMKAIRHVPSGSAQER